MSTFNEQEIELVCDNCGTIFKRRIHDHKYNLKKGRRLFCSRKCSNEFSHDERVKRIRDNALPIERVNAIRLSKQIPLTDKEKRYQAFRYILLKARKAYKERNKKVVKITIDDLEELWNKQNGICVYTGVQLRLFAANYSSSTKEERNRLYYASLDRIDSTKGYIKGNIQFISTMANHAKGISTDEEMKLFCQYIIQHNKKFLDIKY